MLCHYIIQNPTDKKKKSKRNQYLIFFHVLNYIDIVIYNKLFDGITNNIYQKLITLLLVINHFLKNKNNFNFLQ